MDFAGVKILCIEPCLAVLETRCAILKYSGYDTVSASPQLALKSCSATKLRPDNPLKSERFSSTQNKYLS